MTYLILKIMINALSLVAAVKLVDGITFTGEWWKMIVIGAIFGLINSLIKPITKLLTFPLIILTLGLFTLVINAVMLTITAELSESLNLGLQIHGFWPAVKGAIIVSFVSVVLSWVTGVRWMKP